MDIETYRSQAKAYLPQIERAMRVGAHAAPEDDLPTVEKKAVEDAGKLLDDPSFREKICPFLRGVSKNAGDLVDAIAPVMFPMVVSGAIPTIPAVAAAVVYLILKSGVDSVCPQ